MLPHPDPDLCRAFADDLTAADYGSDTLRTAWGDTADSAIARGLRTPALRAIDGRRDPVAVLGRLLMLGIPQPEGDVDAALPTVGAAGLERLGLAEVVGADVVPRALVRPQAFADADGQAEWWVASDLDEVALGGPLPENHVLGVGGASLTLAGLQSPARVGRVLDLGTGCGIQALRARRAADTVIATDVSARALHFTRLNALLNGVDGIETREGSMFGPVAGERFERIVSNPPFVITPRAADVPAYEYRDGGLVGDALVESFVAQVGAHLAPGGIAQLLGNWETRDGVDGLDRVRAWVAASPVPLDAWVVEREALDPIAYAELWIRDGGTVPGSPAFTRLADAWLDDFAARGVDGVGFGYIVLHRPVDGVPTLSRYERLPQAVPGPLGPHIAAALATFGALAAMDDAQLSASTLRVAGDVTEARHHMPGEESPTVIELRQGGGFARTLEVDPALAALVGACDGDLPVGVLVAAIADLLEVDADDLRADLLPRVRELLFTGFLTFG